MLICVKAVEGFWNKLRFGQLVHKYEKLMFHVAYGILNDKKDAEDAVQEAFLSIAKYFSKISDIDCPQTRNFIVIITERKAIDMYRRNKRSKTADIYDTAGVTYDDIPCGSTLAYAMARLPARYREVIVLKFQCGYSTEEVAEILGLKRETAKKLIYRAKESLRAELENEGVEV